MTRPSPSLRPFALAALFLAVLPAAGAGSEALPRPLLIAESDGGTTRLWVETALPGGGLGRRLLRETVAALSTGTTGRDPAQRAAFATWTEDGQAWSAFSRDAGATWVEPRPLSTALRLHDGATAPDHAMPRAPTGFGLPETGSLFLVQFRTVGLPEWRTALAELGTEVLSHVPHNAHIVRMPPALAELAAGLDFVERVEPYDPWLRIEPPLREWARATDDGTTGDAVRVNVVSLEWGPAAKRRILADAEALGARAATWFPSGHILELWVDREQLRRVAAHDDVLWIDRWTEPEDDMDLVRQDAGTDWQEASFGRCGQGVRGEVMDSGIQHGHPDFPGILLHGPKDVSSHGTSTYGIIFGQGNGNPQGTGHMPCAEQGIFADYSYLSDRFAHTQELTQSPYFASFQSNSWGDGRTTLYNSKSQEMDDIIWRLDIAITQSQSNAGTQSSRPQAWAKNIISVGGINHYNTLDTSDDAWNFGASIGPAADGRIKPDLNYWYDSIFTTTTNSGYTSGFGGTSAATPEVAGVLGLVVQMWAENVWGTDPQGTTVFEKQPRFSTIKALLVNNAVQYPFSGTGADLTRVHQGWGRPNVQVAQERAGNSFIVNEEEPLALSQSISYPVLVPTGESELKVTMVYPDPPGTTSSTLHRINDLNLRVTSPSAAVYHGNHGLDAGTESLAGGSPNDVDTVENVFVVDPEAGTWIVTVEAVEINQDAYLATPEDDATFALVVTGAGGRVQTCGNDEKEPGEECDGTDLGGLTCAELGCTGGGTLACGSGCIYDTSGCTGCPPCGDGSCDPGESCHRCPADCISESTATCGNSICETADGEDCVSCPDDCNGAQSGKPANRYCCGDGDGENPIGCGDGRCGGDGKACFDIPSPAYCCGDGECTGAEDLATCGIDCTVVTPGEASSPAAGQMVVNGYDAGTGVLTVSYGSACQASDHHIEYGALTRADLQAYNWAGQECGIGTTGVYDWTLPASPASVFFVIVGNDGSAEGSYGRTDAGIERAEDTESAACPMPQDLVNACQ